MREDTDFYNDDIIDYRYYLNLLKTVLLKNYKAITAFCLICVLASVLYVQSQAPSYFSTVTLHIAPASTMFSFEQWYMSDDDKFQDTQIGILESNKLLRRVVEKISLHEEGKLTPESFDVGLVSTVKGWIADLRGPQLPVTIPAEDLIRSTTEELGSLLTIAKPPRRETSSLLNVTVRMANPILAARTANTIADEYMALVFENEINNARKNQQFLTDRLLILREDLKTAEARLQAYRESENILSRTSGLTELDDELASLSNRYFEARENRLRQENLYQQVRNVKSGGRSWEKLSAISNHPRITTIQSGLFDLNRRKSELSKRYGSRHNTMIALNSEIEAAGRGLENEVRDVVEGIKNEYQLSKTMESAAESTLNDVKDRKQLLGRKEFQLNDLVQEIETKRDVYSIFLERLNQDGASGPVRNDNLWIADPAVIPKAGQRTPLARAGLMALVLSLGAALGIGLLFELTSNTIASGDDVEKKLNMSLLGYLPLLEGDTENPGLTFDEYTNNPESRFSEALRTIRTSITLSNLNTVNVNRFLVTSSQRNEGKTSVSLCLAAAFGQTSKVLIIDGDLRKPSIERVLNTTNHKFPGLADVIANTVTVDEAIQQRPADHIDVMFAGSKTLKPLELLSSTQFRQLMEELGSRYDTIIIDSPPCVSVSDAYVISTLVDSIIFVTKSEAVPVPVIRHCLSRFSGIDASVLGILINQIDFNAAHHYGRYQDYYDYLGYEEPTELSVVNS